MPNEVELNDEAMRDLIVVLAAWGLRLSAYAMFAKFLKLSKRQSIGFGVGLTFWASANELAVPVIGKNIERIKAERF